MPLFHFRIVVRGKREHVGSIDLQSVDGAIPVVLQLTTRLLAGVAQIEVRHQTWTVQATDETGAVVYHFDASDCEADRALSGYVH